MLEGQPDVYLGADQVAEGWTREQKDKCLDETEKAFAVSSLAMLIGCFSNCVKFYNHHCSCCRLDWHMVCLLNVIRSSGAFSLVGLSDERIASVLCLLKCAQCSALPLLSSSYLFLLLLCSIHQAC